MSPDSGNGEENRDGTAQLAELKNACQFVESSCPFLPAYFSLRSRLMFHWGPEATNKFIRSDPSVTTFVMSVPPETLKFSNDIVDKLYRAYQKRSHCQQPTTTLKQWVREQAETDALTDMLSSRFRAYGMSLETVRTTVCMIDMVSTPLFSTYDFFYAYIYSSLCAEFGHRLKEKMSHNKVTFINDLLGHFFCETVEEKFELPNSLEHIRKLARGAFLKKPSTAEYFSSQSSVEQSSKASTLSEILSTSIPESVASDATITNGVKDLFNIFDEDVNEDIAGSATPKLEETLHATSPIMNNTVTSWTPNDAKFPADLNRNIKKESRESLEARSGSNSNETPRKVEVLSPPGAIIATQMNVKQERRDSMEVGTGSELSKEIPVDSDKMYDQKSLPATPQSPSSTQTDYSEELGDCSPLSRPYLMAPDTPTLKKPEETIEFKESVSDTDEEECNERNQNENEDNDVTFVCEIIKNTRTERDTSSNPDAEIITISEDSDIDGNGNVSLETSQITIASDEASMSDAIFVGKAEIHEKKPKTKNSCQQFQEDSTEVVELKRRITDLECQLSDIRRRNQELIADLNRERVCRIEAEQRCNEPRRKKSCRRRNA